MTLEMKLDEMREQGIAEGLEQGRTEGQSNLLMALQALLEGRDDASILSEGIDPDTIDKAREFLNNAARILDEHKK